MLWRFTGTWPSIGPLALPVKFVSRALITHRVVKEVVLVFFLGIVPSVERRDLGDNLFVFEAMNIDKTFASDSGPKMKSALASKKPHTTCLAPRPSPFRRFPFVQALCKRYRIDILNTKMGRQSSSPKYPISPTLTGSGIRPLSVDGRWVMRSVKELDQLAVSH